MNAIVTIINKPYQILLPVWLRQVKKLTDTPIYVLAIEGVDTDIANECNFIKIDKTGNPFPTELPEHSCAEKQRIFEHLPGNITNILFIDIDVAILENFWSDGSYFATSNHSFVAVPDLFVGYKEKMEKEFQPFDPDFRMKFFEDGSYFYFNTGVFFASKKAHSDLFEKSLFVWRNYVNSQNKYPSIFDQNIFNYCLIKFNIPVKPLPLHNNCLRQYSQTIRDGKLLLDGLSVKAMHFNGGEPDIKLSRWLQFIKDLEGQK